MGDGASQLIDVSRAKRFPTISGATCATLGSGSVCPINLWWHRPGEDRIG